MRQVVQNLRSGITEVADVPRPTAGHGQLLVRTTRTLLSAGTERMLVEFARSGWIEKARQQPDKVRAVFEKMKTDGFVPTVEAVLTRLDLPLPLGYCNVGEVIEVGPGVTGFAVGDRIASNGKHAEFVVAPVNLCARVPATVDDESAAFTVLGAIALQGIRLAGPTLGESVAVIGLGLIGLMCVQLLRANGCRVLGIDFDRHRLELASGFGAEIVDLSAGADPVAAAQRFARSRGVDAVLLTAATSSNEPMHQAAAMSRKRGRIVLVGVAGLELSRADFFEKELTFQVSCSYGPGRYDPVYEERGIDYPIGFVRWTEQRNFEAVLDMLAGRALAVAPLISHRFPITNAAAAYDLVAGTAPSLGIILEYGASGPPSADRVVPVGSPPTGDDGTAAVSFIGAGNHACTKLIPAFRAAGVRLRAVASAGGVTALHAAKKFGFEQAATDPRAVLADDISTIAAIATRHDSHAELVLAARASGKHVFVEKPLCLTIADLRLIESAWQSGGPLLMVGFNRRFAPQIRRSKELLAAVPGPKAFVMTVNAGAVPSTHWTQDPQAGGGRLLGECCHFIDLIRYLAGARIASHYAVFLDTAAHDSATITLEFADGSVGAIHYLANGSKAFPKERLEIFAAGRVLQLDNFRRLRAFGWPGFTGLNLWRQDKGQQACVRAFVEAVQTGRASPIPIDEIIEVTRVSIEIAHSVRRT